MSSYYNEFDKKTAAWLRELIKRGLIADGDVDDRSITEVTPDDLRGFKQAHFFAGIGGWSAALHLAGWPDARPVWSGSPPCQPFSAAGKGAGGADPRHLWPVYFDLIRQCRPATLFGEQVAAAIGYGWLDAVQDDMEGEGYAFAKIVLPACSVGAPHLRQRLWFVANAQSIARKIQLPERRPQQAVSELRGTGATGIVAGAARRRWGRLEDSSELGDTSSAGSQGHRRHEPEHGPKERQIAERHDRKTEFWSDLEWLPSRDGKARPTQPGIFPLAHGVSGKTMALRGAGNAIVPQVAAQVIGAYMEVSQ